MFILTIVIRKIKQYSSMSRTQKVLRCGSPLNYMKTAKENRATERRSKGRNQTMKRCDEPPEVDELVPCLESFQKTQFEVSKSASQYSKFEGKT